MTAVSYVPPNVLPPLFKNLRHCLKRKWFREMVLAVADADAAAVLQQDRGLRRLQAFPDRSDRAAVDLCAGHRAAGPGTRKLGGMSHSRTCEPEPHPFKEGWASGAAT